VSPFRWKTIISCLPNFCARAARIIAPVRPDYNEAVLYCDETGEIWNGDGIPAIDNDLYFSLVEELKAETRGGPEGETDGET